MCEYRYRITTEVPIQRSIPVKGERGFFKTRVGYTSFNEFYHPNASNVGFTNTSEWNDLDGRRKHPNWTNWSSGTFGSVDECVIHCSQYFPYREFQDSRIIEVGETKFVHINAQKNDNIERILLHVEEV